VAFSRPIKKCNVLFCIFSIKPNCLQYDLVVTTDVFQMALAFTSYIMPLALVLRANFLALALMVKSLALASDYVSLTLVHLCTEYHACQLGCIVRVTKAAF